MKTLISLAAKSAYARRASLVLAILSIAISVTLLLGVDMVRKQAKASFLNTISQTDLIVGARSGPINLLLYSVFRIGNATNNISYDAYQEIKSDTRVKWAIPLSLGDSHKNFRVVGTNQDYFKFFRYANNQSLALTEGKAFSDLYDAVIGAEVAKALGYQLNDRIVLSHGAVSTDFSSHDDKPFSISGILAPTGTPVDRSVHVSLEALEAIHIDWRDGARSRLQITAEQARDFGLKPKAITAIMLGLNKRVLTFAVQRDVNDNENEALLAIIPGSTLADLWRTLGQFENVLLAVSVMVIVAGLIGVLTMLLSTLNERRREMAVLRTLGAHAYQIILLFVLETLFIVFLGCIIAVVFLCLMLLILQPVLLNLYGFMIEVRWLDYQQVLLLVVVLITSVFFSLIPGLIAYRRSLQDGLTVKL